ncbi:MAG TPA: MEDS domain-containing protein [Methylococcaceae bacterium]|nr:MEDS domain-containing protein [Methylococcaceae bacterium]
MCPARSNHEREKSGSTPLEPIEFAGTTLGEHCHVCGFFNGPEEEYQVLLPFIKAGLERGEKAFHVVDPKLREVHLSQLRSVGIDAAGAELSGQLELRNWDEAYLRDGHFDQARMLALLQGVLDEGRQRGYPLTRLVAHMEWALEDRPGVNDIVEYETRLNYFLPRYRDPVICLYDLSKFGADVVIDIMRTHPMVIIGGVLLENPFFVPPDRLLRELRERGVGASAG